LNYSLEILPRGSDGSYFHEHLVGFSEITKIIKDAKKYHDTGELGSDYTFQDRQQAGINQYARDPKTMKDMTDQPTARTQSDKSIYQPAYRVSFNSPKNPNEKPIIQHSNELSLEEMRKIKEELKRNPKSYVPKTPKNERKARRSFKQ
jgi:hypothetical protein